MAFKLIESAADRWRAVNAPHLVALVRAGAIFRNGCSSNAQTTPRRRREPCARRYRDDLPGLWNGLRSPRPPASLLHLMPPNSMATSTDRTRRTGRGPIRNGLRLPRMRRPFPRRTALRPVQHLVPTDRTGRRMHPL